ncbi:MAG: hypothetical protein AAF587_41115 [Bacteroidota bacterium]
MNAQENQLMLVPTIWRTLRPYLFLCLLVSLLIWTSCKPEHLCEADECGMYPDCVPCSVSDPENPYFPPEKTALDNESIKPDGNFVPSNDVIDGFGYEGSGKLTFELGCDQLVLEVEDANIKFNSDSVFAGLSGRVKLPEQESCFLIGAPENPDDLFKVDVFFHSGAYINAEYDLKIDLEEERQYFIFAARSDLNLGLCAPGSSHASESLSFSLNLGQIIYLIDLCDPMRYVDYGSGLIGRKAIGKSSQGQLTFEADLPVTGEIEDFLGKSLRYQAFTYKGLLKLEGLLVQNKDIDATLATDNFLESDFNVGYQAGFNGSAGLSLKVMSLPMGQASVGFSVEGGTSGAGLRAYLRGITDAYGGWWPEIIPLKPINTREVIGYINSDNGEFALSMETSYGIELPSGMSVVSGENAVSTTTRITDEEFSFTRAYTLGDNTFDMRAAIREGETELSTGLPPSFANNLRQNIIERLGLRLEEIEEVQIDYQSAFENYQLALGLDGLREQIPSITAYARTQIDLGVQKGKNEAASRIPDRLKCSSCSRGPVQTQINAWIEDVADEYRDILDELDAAVAVSVDNDQSRQRIKAALQALIGKRQLTGSRTFNRFCVKQDLPWPLDYACVNNPTGSFTVNLAEYNIDVLSNSEVALLSQAASKVSDIPVAYQGYVDAKAIFDQLEPEFDRISDLRDGFEEVSQPLPDIGRVGFLKNHINGEFLFFYDKGEGSRVTLDREFDPFDPDTFLDAFFDL